LVIKKRVAVTIEGAARSHELSAGIDSKDLQLRLVRQLLEIDDPAPILEERFGTARAGEDGLAAIVQIQRQRGGVGHIGR